MVFGKRAWAVAWVIVSTGCAGGGTPTSKPAVVPPPAEERGGAGGAAAPAADPAPGSEETCTEVGQRCAGGVCLRREGHPFECVLEARLYEDFEAPELLGKRIGSAESYFRGSGGCTKKGCLPDKPCCNSCQARLLLPHEQPLPPLASVVNECVVRSGEPHAFVGVVERNHRGQVALRLEWFEPAPNRATAD